MTGEENGGTIARSADALRLGFFGAFHPMTDRAGAASTGMVLLLARSPRVRSLVVFGPEGARPPEGVDLPVTEVRPTWASDHPLSLVAALQAMVRRAPELDGYLFSINPTLFGRKSLANGLGMLLPVAVRRLTGKPVVVFMHNLVVSQDFRTLGYNPSPGSLAAARWLERTVGRSTRVAAGLESMVRAAHEELRIPIDFVPMRYVESAPVLLSGDAARLAPAERGPEEPRRILFFGVWGPQKDLAGALEMLEGLGASAGPFTVTVAGGAHPNFPEYAERLRQLAERLPAARYRFLGHVAEPDVPALFRAHDVLVLPYRAAGGYSGVMNVGATYGIPIIAYDHPQLRECARVLGVDARFIPAGDGEAFQRALTAPPEATPAGSAAQHLADAQAAIEGLLDLYAPGPRPVDPAAVAERAALRAPPASASGSNVVVGRAR